MTAIDLGNGYTAHAVIPSYPTVTPVAPPTVAVTPSVITHGDAITGIAVYMPPAVIGAQPITYPFTAPAATWTVRHGLGRYPLVHLVDATGSQIDADVEFSDLNTVVVTHAQPLAGCVLLI